MDSQAQLALLLRVNSVLNSSSTIEQIMEQLIQEVISTLQARRGLVFLLRDQEWVILAKHSAQSEPDPEWMYSRTVVRKVAESGEPVLTSDALADERYRDISSLTLHGVHSILCAPLRWDGQVRGIVYADHTIRHGIFQEAHLQVLKAIADQASRTLEMSALHQQLQVIHQQHRSPAATVDYLVQSLSEAQRPAPARPGHSSLWSLSGLPGWATGRSLVDTKKPGSTCLPGQCLGSVSLHGWVKQFLSLPPDQRTPRRPRSYVEPVAGM